MAYQKCSICSYEKKCGVAYQSKECPSMYKKTIKEKRQVTQEDIERFKTKIGNLEKGFPDFGLQTGGKL